MSEPAASSTRDGGALQGALEQILEVATREAAVAAPLPQRRGEGAPRPAGFPGAVAVVAHRGRVVARAHAGWARLFAEDGAPLPAGRREDITGEHVWDIASITKVVVTLAALVQVDRGALGLDAPVASYLPGFADAPDGAASPGARARITVRHLLTHTAGLPSVCEPWTVEADRAGRSAYVLSRPLERGPGAAHLYSCVGYMTLGLALERVTGTPLPELVAETVTGPLGMAATRYGPAGGRPAVATEYQPGVGRGLVCGEVHDEAAWSLGGAGNAGLFSDADDLLALGEEVRTGARGLLREETRSLLSVGTLAPDDAALVGYDQALGFRLGEHAFMGTDDRSVLGHTGFTGTSLVIDPGRELVVILLTNRVHPGREAFDVMPARRAVADAARAWADAR